MLNLHNKHSQAVWEAVGEYKERLAQEVKTWDEGLELYGEPGSSQCYVSAALHLTRMVRPHIHPRLQIMALDTSMEVTSSFLYTCALLARQEKLNQAILCRLAIGEDSYRSLLVPAKTTLKVSNAFQRVAGMRRESDMFTRRSSVLSRYKVTARGFALTDPEITAEIAEYYAPGIDTSLPEGKCPAPKLGLVRAGLSAMVQIANTDRRLFAATLAQDS